MERIIEAAEARAESHALAQARRDAADPNDPREVALGIVARVDQRLAETSETIFRGHARDALLHCPADELPEQLDWWLRAYGAYEVALGRAQHEEVIDLILVGDLDGAEALA